VGEFVRFYGNQVWHYTVNNDTDHTRVSLDFRVIREQEWTPEAFSHFQLGGFFSVMTPCGVLPADSLELRQLQERYHLCAPCPSKKA